MSRSLLSLTIFCCGLVTACGSGNNPRATGEGQMNLIAESVLAEVLDNDGLVCVVTVRSATVTLAGTRSARFVADVDVVRAVHGDCGTRLEIRGYAANDTAPLSKGGTYVVAVTPSDAVNPAMALDGRVEIDPAEAAEAARAHAALIGRLGGDV